MKAVALISGGIDSPIAVYLMLKKDVEIIALHMDNRPFTCERQINKSIEMIKQLEKTCKKKIKFHSMSFGDTSQLEIARNCKRNLQCVICRRMMLRLAKELAVKEGATTIITGESLGQVASQTLRNIKVESQAIKFPILRPLIGFDKEEIIKIAKEIGTYDISIQPGVCCNIVPKKPSTHANLEKVIYEEEKLDIDLILKKALDSCKSIDINDVIKEIDILRFQKKKLEKCTDIVAEEGIAHIKINSESSFSTILTLDDVKNFVYGYLLTEGYIKSKEEILKYSEEKNGNVFEIIVNIKNKIENQVKNYNIIWTGCGVSDVQRNEENFKKIKNNFKLKVNDIFKIKNEIKDKTDLFKKTGAFHYAFIYNKNISLENYAYDIGRHNAVDKVIGKIIFNNGNIDDKILYTTGRVTSDIILKCLRVKIPLIITRSASLYNAIILSRKYNIGLIGFLRGGRFNIYSNFDLIEK